MIVSLELFFYQTHSCGSLPSSEFELASFYTSPNLNYYFLIISPVICWCLSIIILSLSQKGLIRTQIIVEKKSCVIG